MSTPDNTPDRVRPISRVALTPTQLRDLLEELGGIVAIQEQLRTHLPHLRPVLLLPGRYAAWFANPGGHAATHLRGMSLHYVEGLDRPRLSVLDPTPRSAS